MKRLVSAIVAISAVAAGSAGGWTVPAARAAVPAAGSWGKAIEVPGLAALNTAGFAEVNSVSCASAGDCAAGGGYSGHGSGGFVAAERNGRWGKAMQVPGLAALNKGGYAEVNSVSCASAGSCAAGGPYNDGQGFVAAERNSRWVPGLAALGRGAGVVSVSCASAGSCAAGGGYSDRSRHPQEFVASEHNGRWGTAIPVPGLAALDKGRATEFSTVSCAPAGTCAAGGFYTDASGNRQGYIVTQTR